MPTRTDPPVTPIRAAVIGVAAVAVLAAVALLLHGEPSIPHPGSSAGDSHQAQAPRPTRGRPLRLGVVGDSISHGYYASKADLSWPALLGAHLRHLGPVAEEVDAVPGETAEDALLQAVPTEADIVVIELGTNDARRKTGAAFEQAYRKLLRRIAQASPSTALLCLDPWGPEAAVAAYSRTVDRLCRAAGGRSASLSGIYGVENDRARSGIPFFEGTSRDDFHPDDRGHAAIARLVESMIPAPQ